jgi:cyclic pyranopterin monophosphate synthase
VSPRGWNALGTDVRQAIAVAGMHDSINIAMVQDLVKFVPPNFLKLVPKMSDPAGDAPTAVLTSALGPMRSISPKEWASLSALDRYVLDSLSINTRLLWRALEEISSAPNSPLAKTSPQPWSGALARCEIFLRPEAFRQLMQGSYLGGRAMVLARVAGVRAARRTFELFDLQAETVAGPAELDWCATKNQGVLLWQGHVSTWEGAFYPAASLLAVSTAAVAVYDMVKDFDPHASISGAGIAEEAWKVGAMDEREEPTAVFTPGRGD